MKCVGLIDPDRKTLGKEQTELFNFYVWHFLIKLSFNCTSPPIGSGNTCFCGHRVETVAKRFQTFWFQECLRSCYASWPRGCGSVRAGRIPLCKGFCELEGFGRNICGQMDSSCKDCLDMSNRISLIYGNLAAKTELWETGEGGGKKQQWCPNTVR